MATLILIAQEIVQDFPTQSPSPSLLSWWPIIGWIVTAIFGLISAWYAGTLKIKEKKVEVDRDTESRRITIQLETMKLEFEQRKEFVESLVEQTNRGIAENQKISEELWKAKQELWKAIDTVNERNEQLKKRDDQITKLERDVVTLQAEVHKLQAEVQKLEQQRAVNPQA